MPQHIGIVGASAEGAALCYRTICVEGADLLGTHAHPEVSMHTHSLADYMRCVYRGDWQGVGELIISSAEQLIEPRSPLPWRHIAEVVAAEAVERGFRRLGLIGTRWLVESDE
jgi:aspartate racemase